MATNKQKRALRNRQKIANRQPSKEKQIRQLISRLDNLPINAFTGEPNFPERENDIPTGGLGRAH